MVSDSQVRQLRLRGQRLHPPHSSATSVRQVVTDVCGIQTQETEAGALSIRVRCAELTANDIIHAQIEDRSIIRTWTMRGTLHLVAADDLRWLLSLLGPVFIRSSRKRRLDLGLDEETGERGVSVLRELLGERGPLTKAEIAENLSAKGIPMDGQASIHLIGLAALQGLVCYGPDMGRKNTFVLLEDWLGKKIEIPAENGIDELARRYLTAFAPATVDDFASWSGLGIRECRTAWEKLAQLVEVKLRDSTAWMLKYQLEELNTSTENKPVVRLLPRYDTYLLGYADRSLIIDPEHVKRIYPGGGLLHPALLVDGKVAGMWKINRKRDHIEVQVESFGILSREVRQELETEVKELAYFYGLPTVMKCNLDSNS